MRDCDCETNWNVTPAAWVRGYCAALCLMKSSSLLPATPVCHGGPGTDASGGVSRSSTGKRNGDSLNTPQRPSQRPTEETQR